MRWLLTFSALVALCAASELAKAGPVVDQSFQGPANVAHSFSVGPQEAQVFTVGLAGNLVQIDVNLERPTIIPVGNLFFDIVNASGGVPPLANAPVLASGSVPLASIPASATSDSLTGFSIPVSVGQQLAIVLTTDEFFFDPAWLFQDGGTYPNGEAFARHSSPPNSPWFDQSGDFLFQTFVDPTAATPEPSAIALFGLGLAGMLGYGWRRRRAANV